MVPDTSDRALTTRFDKNSELARLGQSSMAIDDCQLSEAELLALQADPIAMLQFLIEQSTLPKDEASAVVQLAQELWSGLQASSSELSAEDRESIKVEQEAAGPEDERVDSRVPG